jgi:agmatine/peptidylarginine deiminase
MGFSCDGFILKPRFKPDYCTDIYTDDYLSLVDEQTRYIINKTINVPIKKCDLVWDGGNLGTNGKQAFVIEKIVRDNPSIDLQLFFKKELNLNLILLPQNKYDVLGHTDGCFQFINSSIAVVSSFTGNQETYDSNYLNGIAKRLELSNVNIIRTDDFLSLDIQKGICSSKGIHVNFIQLNNMLIYPYYNSLSCDVEKVLGNNFNSFKNNDSNKLSELGGSVHCVSFAY